jgi:hypothetical protein
MLCFICRISSRNWDAVHFLLEDRRSRGEALGADLVASILKGALQQPYG